MDSPLSSPQICSSLSQLASLGCSQTKQQTDQLNLAIKVGGAATAATAATPPHRLQTRPGLDTTNR